MTTFVLTSHVFCAEPNVFSIGMAETVSVMKLPVYNLVIRVHKYDEAAKDDADDAHLHTNSERLFKVVLSR